MKPVAIARWAARIALLGSLVGCGTGPKIVSARDPAFDRRISHLLVLVADDGTNDAQPIRMALQARLNARRIQNRVLESSGDGPGDTPPATDGFEPEATLHLTPNVTIRNSIGARVQVNVDASLYLPGDTSHRIWRAKVIHGAASANIDASGGPHWATLFARRVVDQLVADGLLM